jgi:hypothetical protein
MRVVDIRQTNVDEDIREGRRIVQSEINNPSMSVLIIRGASADVSRFVDLASARCDPFPWRSGVWVRDERIFKTEDKARWFDGHDDACGVLLDLNDRPSAWLRANAQLFDIEQAWLSAEGRA